MNIFKTHHYHILVAAIVAIFALAVLIHSTKPVAEPKKEVHLIISAGASLKDAMEEVKTLYISQHPELNIDLNFGSSGQLLQQIEQGAPVDVFISAGKAQMDQLEAKGLIENTTRKNFLGNDLVLVVPTDSNIKNCTDLLKPEIGKVAIGEMKTVPCGKYAQESLTHLGIWDQLEAKLVLGSDVKQVLAYVESGNAEAGFVYSSDAFVSQKVKIAAVIDNKLHSDIVYPAAVIKSTLEKESAQEFMNFLYEPVAKNIFVKYGFKPMD